MNRNAKIALGCGGAGCLGLIVVAIAGGAIYYFSQSSSNRNYNYNYNRSANYNSNDNSNYNSNLNSNTDDTSASSSMTSDEKHRLFQAAAATNDTAITMRVWRKLGFVDASGTPNEEYAEFLKQHFAWVFRNADFLETINTPEKARAYVEAHIDD